MPGCRKRSQLLSGLIRRNREAKDAKAEPVLVYEAEQPRVPGARTRPEYSGGCLLSSVFLEVGTLLAHNDGVTPLVETNCNWHTCRSMIFPTQTAASSSQWSSAGEAEAGSAGEQPAKE